MNFSKRIAVVKALVYGCSLALILNLFQIQVIQGGHYAKLGERNRIRLIPIPAPRGKILDRNGLVFATNRPAYGVYITPEDFDPEDLTVLSELLRLSADEIRHRLGVTRMKALTPIAIKKDVGKEIAMQIEERKPTLSGVFIQAEGVRYYPNGALNGHVLGYIGKISQEEYRTLDRDVFGLHSYIGRAGVEKTFDDSLRGEDGGRQIEVNARGEQLKVLSEKKPVAGKDITLSLDLRLENEIVPFLGNRRISVALMEIETGEMLALLNHPDFDPNVFVESEKDEERLKLLKDKTRPLINRAATGLYPAGSIFKLVTALAGLETGKITRYTTFECKGHFRLSPRSRMFKCWEPEGHGQVDLYKALERSCNVYFYNVGRLAGEKAISNYAHMLGFGEPLGMEIPSSDGLIPSAEWKRARYSDSWYLGETVSFAIGQGYVLVSPLQVLRMVSIIAKDGIRPDMSIIKDHPRKSQFKSSVYAHQDSFKAIKQGMLRVVESKFGTGQLARIDFLRLAGKTGTAQAPPEEPHAWFVGFFPYEAPKVALVVFVEHGGSGGLVAAKVVKQILPAWKKLYSADTVYQKPELPPVNL